MDQDNPKRERPKRTYTNSSAAPDIIAIKHTLMVDPTGNEKYTLNHIRKLINKRGDISRLNDIKELYFDAFPHASEINIRKFYFWYRDNPISSEDELVYNYYLTKVAEYGIKRANPSVFAERGLSLLFQLLEWSEGAGNPLEELLAIYFSLVIPRVVAFNVAILNSPRSILEDYGWGQFMSAVQDAGGKHIFLRANEADAKKEKIVRAWLDVIEEHRQKLLADGNIEEYDRIGHDVAVRGIEAVSREIKSVSKQ